MSDLRAFQYLSAVLLGSLFLPCLGVAGPKANSEIQLRADERPKVQRPTFVEARDSEEPEEGSGESDFEYAEQNEFTLIEREKVTLAQDEDKPKDGLQIDKKALEKAAEEHAKAQEAQKHKGLPSGFAGKSGVTPQSLALPDGSGSMQGMGESFTPNLNTGSGTFSIPIPLPPGRRGVQPQLGIAYSTGAGNGVLGWGWAIGVPMITRQADKGLARYKDSDQFIYNGGQELVPVKMPSDEQWPQGFANGTDGKVTYYRSRIEGAFMRFFYNRTTDSWLIQDRQGNHFFYGETANAKLSTPKGTAVWYLSHQADARNALGAGGNDVRYVYKHDGGNVYLDSIYWNSYAHEYGVTSKYQHQAKLVYEVRPDVAASYAHGFRVETALRLTRVEVRSYQNGPTSKVRSLVRVMLFRYEKPEVSYHTRLVQVQTCGSDWSSTNSGTCMPAVHLRYTTHVGLTANGFTQANPVPGFGSFNEVVKELTVSPDVSVEDPNVDLLDVNQDGLPDVLLTRDTGLGKDHAAILNDGLDGLDPNHRVRVENPGGWSLKLDNLNVALMDVDGAGNADLLHMPYNEKYHYYRLLPKDDHFEWRASGNIPVNKAIDFTGDASNIRMVDINNDHLVDIVRSTGARMQHFLNLSAFPGYAGQFGRLDENGYPEPNASIDTCVLARGGAKQFDSDTLVFGDMNGDGLQDIVDVKSGAIAYWPNRGYGQWGDSEEDCGPGEYVDGTEIEMGGSPYFHDLNAQGTLLADMNGDGLADLVQLKFASVDIWLNRGDDTFAERLLIEKTPFTNSSMYGKVRLADINGSGTVDIVWADAGGWKYLDLAGDYRNQPGNAGLSAGLLEEVENGLGGTTRIEYTNTTELMVQAHEQGDPWQTTGPMPMVVVEKVISEDNLDLIGEPAGRYVQQFVYRDPYYDADEAEFKGFGYAETWDRETDADGDGKMDRELCTAEAIRKGEAPIVGRTWFHRGIRPECMERPDGIAASSWPAAWGPGTKACIEQQHRDNPLLGVQGVAIQSDSYSPCTGEIIKATASEVEVRKLFKSEGIKDDRSVWFVRPNHGRIYHYQPETTSGDSSGTPEPYPWLSVTSGEYTIPQIAFTPHAPDGTFHRVDGWTEVDSHGYPTRSVYAGYHRYSGAPLYEHAGCDQYTDVFEMSFDPRTWVHMVKKSYKLGPQNEESVSCPATCTAERPCDQLEKTYDQFGDLETSTVTVFDVDGSMRRLSGIARNGYNSFGQVVHEYGGCFNGTLDSCLRHVENVFSDEDDGDLHYSSNIRQEIAYVADGVVKEFRTKARWNAGQGVITRVTGSDGSATVVEYDKMGRVVRKFAPDPRQPGAVCEEPISEINYHFAAVAQGEPLNLVEAWLNTSSEVCGGDRWEVVRTWTDGLMRKVADVAPGDKVKGANAKAPWVMSAKPVRNAKGAPIVTCQGLPISAPPSTSSELLELQNSRQAQLAAEMELADGLWLCGKSDYDAFGRQIRAFAQSDHPDAVNGWVEAKYENGIDFTRSFDHRSLHDPEFAGLYVLVRNDGLGRTVRREKWHKESDSQTPTPRVVTYAFGAMGGPIVVTEEDRGVKRSRRTQYDSLGRMRINETQSSGRWEYKYNELGELVGTVDPMGRRSQYAFDRAGRLVRESYDGQLVAQYFWDAYPGDAVLGLSANSEWEGYPSWAQTFGRIVAVKDRSGVSITAADRGSLHTEAWRTVYPDPRLYHSETQTNWAGELIYSEDPDGKRSTADYWPDGRIRSSYYDGRKVVDEIESSWNGQAELVRYADAAKTEVWTGYSKVTGQVKASVVQQQARVYAPGGVPEKVTLLAYGYEYDVRGNITGITDWRGRGAGQTAKLGMEIPHPTALQQSLTGWKYAGFPAHFDTSFAAPRQWNAGDITDTPTGWPVGSTPYDVAFRYDTFDRLEQEEREYATASGDDILVNFENSSKSERRMRKTDYEFDALGSMIGWNEASPSGAARKGLGRALGDIKNGLQIDAENGGCDLTNWALVPGPMPNCRKPDAVYFASNVSDVGAGKGTCVWLDYDAAGHMTSQTVREGCSSCSYDASQPHRGVTTAVCPGAPQIGMPGQPGFEPEIAAKTTRYEYTWNALGELAGAQKREDGMHTLSMAYLYDASGGRIVRQQSDVSNGQLTNISQDIYLGGYERRGVKLVNKANDQERSVFSSDFPSAVGQYHDADGARITKYSSGLRIERRFEMATGKFGPETRYLGFNNHLGSTGVVIDFDNGALVEWRNAYAYGADEAHWKNGNVKYAEVEEPYKFTGKEEDEAVGLFYFGARYYSANLGRWLSPDPPVVHGVGELRNSYLYGLGSPYGFVDPDGRTEEPVSDQSVDSANLEDDLSSTEVEQSVPNDAATGQTTLPSDHDPMTDVRDFEACIPQDALVAPCPAASSSSSGLTMGPTNSNSQGNAIRAANSANQALEMQSQVVDEGPKCEKGETDEWADKKEDLKFYPAPDPTNALKMMASQRGLAEVEAKSNPLGDNSNFQMKNYAIPDYFLGLETHTKFLYDHWIELKNESGVQAVFQVPTRQDRSRGKNWEYWYYKNSYDRFMGNLKSAIDSMAKNQGMVAPSQSTEKAHEKLGPFMHVYEKMGYPDSGCSGGLASGLCKTLGSETYHGADNSVAGQLLNLRTIYTAGINSSGIGSTDTYRPKWERLKDGSVGWKMVK